MDRAAEVGLVHERIIVWGIHWRSFVPLRADGKESDDVYVREEEDIESGDSR